MNEVTYKRQLFMVEIGNIHVLTWSFGREGAKRDAQHWLGMNPDDYTVTPLTEQGDRVHLAVTLYV